MPGSVNGWPVTNMACIRCLSVSCNHGMLISRSQGTVVRNSKWRCGNPDERRGILANGQTGLCNYGSPPCLDPRGRVEREPDLRSVLRPLAVQPRQRPLAASPFE